MLNQHRFNLSCICRHISPSRWNPRKHATLTQCLTSVGQTLVQCLVFAGMISDHVDSPRRLSQPIFVYFSPVLFSSNPTTAIVCVHGLPLRACHSFLVQAGGQAQLWLIAWPASSTPAMQSATVALRFSSEWCPRRVQQPPCNRITKPHLNFWRDRRHDECLVFLPPPPQPSVRMTLSTSGYPIKTELSLECNHLYALRLASPKRTDPFVLEIEPVLLLKIISLQLFLGIHIVRVEVKFYASEVHPSISSSNCMVVVVESGLNITLFEVATRSSIVLKDTVHTTYPSILNSIIHKEKYTGWLVHDVLEIEWHKAAITDSAVRGVM